VPSKIPAPPEAKLTPVRNDPLFLLDLDTKDRYGGEVGRPTFSAAQKKIYSFQIIYEGMKKIYCKKKALH
jgi:hypothetical protein